MEEEDWEAEGKEEADWEAEGKEGEEVGEVEVAAAGALAEVMEEDFEGAAAGVMAAEKAVVVRVAAMVAEGAEGELAAKVEVVPVQSFVDTAQSLRFQMYVKKVRSVQCPKVLFDYQNSNL